ncbi:MAG: hypothetical protein JJ975_10570 [Bacteroidia bacterium]|nr:hypothetical protein [Bacteroidia bacterium]
MKIDLQNYESVFFNLLEGIYNEEEEQQLMQAIEGDSFLRFEWENWQKAKLVDDADSYADDFSVFFDTLKEEADVVEPQEEEEEEENPKRLWLWPLATGIAASLVLFLFLVNQGGRNNGNEPVANEVLDKMVEETLVEAPRKNEVEDVSKEVEKVVVTQETVAQPINEEKGQPIDIPAPKPIDLPQEEIVFDEPIDPMDRVEVAVMDTTPDENLTQIAAVDEPVLDFVQDGATTEVGEQHKTRFTVSRQDVKKKEVFLSRSEIGNASWRKLLEDKTIRLVWIGDKTYLRLESEDQESVLIGLQQ